MENRIEPRQNRPVQLAKARKNGWTKTRRAAFLAELAQSCNVARAHAAAGSRSDGWQLAPASLAGDTVALAAFREAGRGEVTVDPIERRRAPLSALPGTIRLRHYEPERDYQLGQQSHAIAGGGVREERIDLPAVLAAGAARGLARVLAGAAADGRETCVWQADLAALALPVGGRVALDDGSAWRLARRTARGNGVTIELMRHQPLPGAGIPADPGVQVSAPDWPDATGVVRLFDLPSVGVPAATAPHIVVAGAGSNDGWRGADCWFVPVADAEPVPLGSLRPAAAMGGLGAALGAGSPDLVDEANVAVVELDNPSMTLESVSTAMLLGGANRAMIGGELIQFQIAEPLSPTMWRLSRLLRGRAGTGCGGQGIGAPFLLLDDIAVMALADELARWATSGDARLQWAERNDVDLTEFAVPSGARAVRPLSPVHPRVSGDGEGGLIVEWMRRSRLDTGWRDEVDLPLGESRERYRVALDPVLPELGPWECDHPLLHIDAATVASLPGGAAMDIRQIGDFALSDPLIIALG